MFACKIEKITNGYILYYRDDDDRLKKYIVEDKEGFQCEKKLEQETFQSVIYALMDIFGIYNSKHNETYLEISVKNRELED